MSLRVAERCDEIEQIQSHAPEDGVCPPTATERCARLASAEGSGYDQAEGPEGEECGR